MYVCAKFSALFGWWNEQARLTDQADWHIALREARGIVIPRGFFDFERRIRPVGTACRALIAAWDGRTGAVQS